MGLIFDDESPIADQEWEYDAEVRRAEGWGHRYGDPADHTRRWLAGDNYVDGYCGPEHDDHG